MKETDDALKVEDLRLITLLEKKDKFREDIKEILEFVVEDLRVLKKGLLSSFSSKIISS